MDIRCAFTVLADYVPEKLFLACETPEIFSTSRSTASRLTEPTADSSAIIPSAKLDISGLMKPGENVIETHVLFRQSDEVYENIEKSRIFESEKNKLTYDMEIEAMYLVGDFGIDGIGSFEDIPHDASFFDGTFRVGCAAPRDHAGAYRAAGLPVLCGRADCPARADAEGGRHRPAAGLPQAGHQRHPRPRQRAGGHPGSVGALRGRSTPYLHAGANTLELTLVNNLRNLLGPHHHVGGELYAVAPPAFYNEPCIRNGYLGGYYTDRYCFVNTSLTDAADGNGAR